MRPFSSNRSSRGWAHPFVLAAIALALLGGLSTGCQPQGDGADTVVQVTIPSGSSFQAVTDSLESRGLVRSPRLFRALARVRGDDRSVKSGHYEIPGDAGWGEILDQLVAGRVVLEPVTIPEGWTLRQISGRLAGFTGLSHEETLAQLEADGLAEHWDVPGPNLEGYLFPDTYQFAPGTSLESVLATMIGQYHSIWTPDRRARLAELGMDERELMTLASIVQAEARGDSEMPKISGVFHNRLRIGYLLQADPTVQFALGERRQRLLYADIDLVADHPYNTYTQPGLPPGPIGAPGEAAIDAALHPADVDYLYFVARPDGTHIFTRTLEEHNRARVEARRQWDALNRSLQRNDDQQ